MPLNEADTCRIYVTANFAKQFDYLVALPDSTGRALIPEELNRKNQLPDEKNHAA